MSDIVQVALIGAAGSALGALFGVFASAKLTQYRLKKLEETVSEHMHKTDRLGDRVVTLENRMTGAEHDIEVLKRQAS